MTLAALIGGLSHIGIRVHDLAASRDFYERLGFTLTAGPLGPEPVAILHHPAGLELNFILNAAAAAAPNILMDVPEKHAGYTHMALGVTDLAATIAALEAAGIPLSGFRGTSLESAEAVFIRDPDRNVIELALPY
jgi:lactoylglutathione lyase